MKLSSSLCHLHGLHFTSTKQAMYTVLPQLTYCTDTVMLSLLTLRLHPWIFPCINATVSIQIPLSWSSLYHCCLHHNHCCSATAAVSITLCIIWCIYHHPTPYDAVYITTSPPRYILYHISHWHCFKYNFSLSISPCLFGFTAVPDISTMKLLYQF